MLSILAFFVLLAILAPLIGADSRDGLDWARDHFWLSRRPGRRDLDRGGLDPDDRDRGGLRMSDSPAPASAAPASAAGCRTAPAAG
jgi:hypothetical protein